MTYWVYSIEKFMPEEKKWITEKRYFRGPVPLDDRSLKDVLGKRRNAIFLHTTTNPPWEIN